MKSSFNYTGRKRLDTSAFEITIYEKDAGPSEVGATINKMNIHNVPPHSVVWIEAYRGPSIKRMSLGTWEKLSGEKRFSLFPFDPREPILFRIKIVDEWDNKHPIKAWRDEIRPSICDPNGKKLKSVLPVFPCDLQHIAWVVDWQDSLHPMLKVNSRISEARDITSIAKKDPDFAALVFPQVLREILTKLLSDDNEEGEENEWVTFASNLTGYNIEIDEDEEQETKEDQIDKHVSNAVQAFGAKLDLIARYNAMKAGK